MISVRRTGTACRNRNRDALETVAAGGEQDCRRLIGNEAFRGALSGTHERPPIDSSEAAWIGVAAEVGDVPKVLPVFRETRPGGAPVSRSIGSAPGRGAGPRGRSCCS
jgi:hypothetical protein